MIMAEASSKADTSRRTVDSTGNVDKSLLCVKCKTKTSSVITLPCGHMCTCEDCIAKTEKCPTCKTQIAGTVKALFATTMD